MDLIRRLGWIGLVSCFCMLLTMGVVHRSSQAKAALPLSLIEVLDPDCKIYDRCTSSASATYGAIIINGLREDLNNPNRFEVDGTIGFSWIPESYPNWSPNQLSIGCISTDCQFAGWGPVQAGRRGFHQVWSASFHVGLEQATSLQFYPFDQHWVHLVLIGKDRVSQNFLGNLDVATFGVKVSQRVLMGENSNFNINYGAVSAAIDGALDDFGDELHSSLTRHSGKDDSNIFRAGAKLLDSINSPQASTFQVSFQVLRRTPIALWMAAIPLSLILLNTNLAFHWREASPANSFGSSGLLAAVSLFFASRVFRPNVDYLVFSDTWFLLTFVLITVNNILLIWLFRFYKHRQGLKGHGVKVKPAFKAENALTAVSMLTCLLILAVLALIAQLMVRPPQIPDAFLAGSSGYQSIGASATKVVSGDELASDQGGLLPYAH